VSAVLLALVVLQSPLDEGTLIVRRDTVELAREEFRLLPRRPDPGWTLAVRSRWTSGAARTLAPVLELGPDSVPRTLQYEVAGQDPVHIVGQAGRGRFTLRYLTRTAERARELPLDATSVVLDDSVLALYQFAAWRARPGSRVTLTAIYPRDARREAITVEDVGLQPTTLNRDPAVLRHVRVTGGAAGEVHLWLDGDGRVMKVQVPARGLVAERQPAN
jgi:hypothetical protein